MVDYFQALDLPRSYAIDPAELDRRYRERSREVHPDKFATAPAAERRQALERSTTLNAAYQTLKDPLRRAGYFLTLLGLPIDAHDAEGRSAIELSPDFLNDFLDLRESFDAHAGDPKVRAETLARVLGERTERVAKLTDALARLPAQVERAALVPHAQRLLELRYYDRFLQDLEDAQEEVEEAP